MNAAEALERLAEGNRRFVSGLRDARMRTGLRRREELVEGQQPFAVVLGCADSRVPVEHVFDQGLGELFVIRVAGNIVDSSQVGSVEFAATQLGTRLVVVLGHTDCGAVKATLEQLEQPSDRVSPGLRAIVDSIRPAVEPMLGGRAAPGDAALMQRAVRSNIHQSVHRLRTASKVLEALAAEQGLLIVGAEYALDSGVVTFLDDDAGVESG